MSEIHTDNMSNIDVDTLNEKTVVELKQIARELELKRVTGLKKQTLIDLIREAVEASVPVEGRQPDGVHRRRRTRSQTELNLSADREEAEREEAERRKVERDEPITQYGGQSHIQTYDTVENSGKRRTPIRRD